MEDGSVLSMMQRNFIILEWMHNFTVCCTCNWLLCLGCLENRIIQHFILIMRQSINYIKNIFYLVHSEFLCNFVILFLEHLFFKVETFCRITSLLPFSYLMFIFPVSFFARVNFLKICDDFKYITNEHYMRKFHFKDMQ